MYVSIVSDDFLCNVEDGNGFWVIAISLQLKCKLHRKLSSIYSILILEIWSEEHCTEISSKHRWLVVGKCVSIHNENEDFYGAQEGCINMDSMLYLPSGAEEFEELRNHLESQRSYYFGLTHQEWIFSNCNYQMHLFLFLHILQKYCWRGGGG